MADLLLIFTHVTSLGIGAALYALWTERRHDCMPHDPSACRDDRDRRIRAEPPTGRADVRRRRTAEPRVHATSPYPSPRPSN